MARVETLELNLTPPSLKDNTAPVDRLTKALRARLGMDVVVALPRAGEVARVLKDSGYRARVSVAIEARRAVVVDVVPPGQSPATDQKQVSEVLGLLPPDEWGSSGLGLAVDVGSTHLEGSLWEIESQSQLARGRKANPQVEIGHDILTRIHAAATASGFRRLHEMLCGALQELAEQLCSQAGRDPGEIQAVVAAGNTTMSHFLLGLDVQGICREPYLPVVNRPAPVFARDIALELGPETVVWVLPNVGAYFGGDAVAGIVAAGMHAEEALAILVDVGTNAEVVLGCNQWLVACAGAAGPALEAGVARMGVLAGPGAIERVEIDPQTLEPSLKIIPAPDGSVPRPRGLCGSGLLSLVAQMYLRRIIDMRGRIRISDHPRIVETDEGLGYVVVWARDSATGEDIVVNEVEIDILLRSKAAMYTILRTITLEVGVEFEQIERFYVAGAFGSVIDPEVAITLGMIPDLPRERFVALGNSALKGCERLLLDPSQRELAIEIAGKITYIELNVNQALMNRFSAARFIPHTDCSRFPTVPCWH